MTVKGEPSFDIDRRDRILCYVGERRCPSGGYCFYRLDEPNAADTWRALRICRLLGELPDDPETVTFLHELQRPDGSYISYSAALSSGLALAVLGQAPLYDPREFILAGFPLPDPGHQMPESLSSFEGLNTHRVLCLLYGILPESDLQDEMVSYLQGCEQPDGGFGPGCSTLVDTWHAAEILSWLGQPPQNAHKFLAACADPEFGYRGKPGVSPPYLEQIHAGVMLSYRLDREVEYPGACLAFLDACYRPTGGFVRSVFGGSPTLEFTCYAVEIHHILMKGEMKNEYLY